MDSVAYEIAPPSSSANLDIRVEVIDRIVAGFQAQKTPAERIAIASSAHRAARTILASVIASQHPEWGEERRHREMLRRLLGRGADDYLKNHPAFPGA